MHVIFKQRIKVPDHPTYIENTTVTLNGTTYPILWLTVLPGKYSNISMMQFDWKFVKYT